MKKIVVLLLLSLFAGLFQAAAQDGARSMTIKEFRRMSKKDTTVCILRGVVTRVRDMDRGKLFIKDETGEVYIYGVGNDWLGRNSFRKYEVREGDTLTLRGRRKVYQGTIEMSYPFLMAKSDGPDHASMQERERCDVDPSFKGGGPDKFSLWVAEHLNYPDGAPEGRVVVQFVVGRNGKVQEVQVLQGAHPLLNEEAVRVVSSAPKWKPGKIDGKPVRVTYRIPVNFSR